MHYGDEPEREWALQPSNSPFSSIPLNSGASSQNNVPPFPFLVSPPSSYRAPHSFHHIPQSFPGLPLTPDDRSSSSETFGFASTQLYPLSQSLNSLSHPAETPLENLVVPQTPLVDNYLEPSMARFRYATDETFSTPNTSMLNTVKLEAGEMPSRWRADTYIKLHIRLFEEPVSNHSRLEHYNKGEIFYPIKALRQYNQVRILRSDTRVHPLDTTLNLYLSVVGNATRTEIRCCGSCQERERKPKPNSKKSSTSTEPTDPSFPLACPHHNVVPISNGTAWIKFRITCYGAHHPHEDGVRVLMTLEDNENNVLAKATTDPVLIVDDHKQRRNRQSTRRQKALTETDEQAPSSAASHTSSSLPTPYTIGSLSNTPLINHNLPTIITAQTAHHLALSPVHLYESQSRLFSGDSTLSTSSTFGEAANAPSFGHYTAPGSQPPAMCSTLQQTMAAIGDDSGFDPSAWRRNMPGPQTNEGSFSRMRQPSTRARDNVQKYVRTRFPGGG